MSTTLDYATCEALIISGVVGKADADISGPGVVTAFIVSAYITMIAILAAYVGGLVDGGLLRPIDRLILRAPSRASRFPRMHVALRKMVISFSDQQIITGIAVLAAGFNGLRTGSISVYHFQIVVYLGWASSSVHLSALTLLRPFLWRHRGMMIWRVIGMATLMVMLLIALVPTLSNDWAIVTFSDDNNFSSPQNGFGVPAICFWGQFYGDGINIDAVFSYLILVVSYAWKMGGLFMPVRNGWQRYLRNPLDTLLEKPLIFLAKRHIQERSIISIWLFRLYFSFWLPVFAVLEILGSFSAALWLSLLGTVYGTLQIVMPRIIARAMDPSLADQESAFGFGQLLALILLIQPLGAVTEHIWLVGQDDEQIYDADVDVAYPSRPSDKTSLPRLLSSFAEQQWLVDSAERVNLKGRIYQSRMFASLVWWTQIGVAVVAGISFATDAYNIGWDTTGNWYLIGCAVGAYIGSTGLLMLVAAPFTSLCRLEDRRNGHMPSSGRHASPQSLEFKAPDSMSSSDHTAWEQYLSK